MSLQELDHLVEELEKIAVVNLLQKRSIISLIGNVERSSLILEKVLLSVLYLLLFKVVCGLYLITDIVHLSGF
jgi:hypothetical protein